MWLSFYKKPSLRALDPQKEQPFLYKPLFKLSIKNDRPILYKGTFSGSRSKKSNIFLHNF